MRSVRKILLVNPPVTRPHDFSAKVVRVSVFVPLGIAYLGAVIEKAGTYELAILDALMEGNTDEGTPIEGGMRIRYGLTDSQLAQKIQDFKPDVIGVAGLFSAMKWDMENVCRIAKQVHPAVKTIVGGTHVSNAVKEIMDECSAIDYAVIGEAEGTFMKILDGINTQTGFSGIDGIAYRQGGGVKVIPKTTYIMDLDSIPFPARHLFDMGRYFESAKSHGFYRNTPYTQMITSRGCPCKCTFCALGAHWGSRQRMRSAKNVLDEIEHLIEHYGVREIHFEDDSLTADKRRALEIFKGMIERKFDIKWHVPSGIAVYTLREDILEAMKASGCYSISLAIESGNQEVITKLMNKPVNLKRVPGLVKKIREQGIDVRGFFIIGYPDETKETIRQTIDFARALELDWSYFSIASPIPHTEMYNTCIKKGYIKEGDFDPIRSFHRSIIRTPEFDPEYLYQIREEAIIDVCFKNNPNLRKYDIERAIEDFSDVVSRYPHFDFAHFYLGEAYMRKGDIQKAVEAYQNTLKANNTHTEAKKRLQELLIKVGDAYGK